MNRKNKNQMMYNEMKIKNKKKKKMKKNMKTGKTETHETNLEVEITLSSCICYHDSV